MERSPYEEKLGVPIRCLRAWRALAGEMGLPPRVAARGGWWSNDDLVMATGHANDRRKLAELRECCPGLIDRQEEPREGASPIALFRLAAPFDPRRRHEAVVQLTLI